MGKCFIGETEKALELVKDFKPTHLQEYILVAAVHATVGQDTGSVSQVLCHLRSLFQPQIFRYPPYDA